jgi:heptosyltransferase-3/putative inorganic carbon (HCO3(-)) transporter
MEESIENKGVVIRTTERCNEAHPLFARSRILLRNTSFFPSFSHGVWRIQAGGLFLLTVFSFFPALFHVEEILFFILLGLALLAGWLEGKNLRIRTPIDLPLLLLLAWILLTIPFSLNPEYSFVEWRKLVAQCLVFYWAVYVIREISQSQQQESSRLPFALVDFIDRGGNWQDRNIRAMAPGSDYNWLSTYLVLAMPIVVYCGIAFRGLWGKIFSVGIFALALLAQAASYTRAGWLASAVQLFSWGLITRRRVLLISFILGIILVLVATMGIGQMGYQGDTLHIWTLETRIQVWKLGMDKIVSHPIVGIGYGNNNFQPALVDSPMGDQPMHLHNTLLMMGVGSGIPGLVLFSWVFVRLGLELFPKKNRQNLADSETLKLCLGIVLVGFFCRNLFDYMFAGSLAYLFWLLMACGLESSMKSRQQTEPYHPH